MTKPLHAGVLILGSLLWDNAERERWRQQRLNMAAAQSTWLPVRYGRLSGKRRSFTHTMVLSNLCYRQYELGRAFVAPCSHPIATGDDLIAEGRELANAEGLNQWAWGAVGVLVNPRTTVTREVLAKWKSFASERLSACDLFTVHTNSERAILSDAGLLRLRWPILVDSSKPVQLDILLATPTAPTFIDGRYPRPREIGELYARQGYSEYFVENVRHNIRTARDKDIWKSSLRLRPEWAKQYADVAVALGLGQVKS